MIFPPTGHAYILVVSINDAFLFSNIMTSWFGHRTEIQAGTKVNFHNRRLLIALIGRNLPSQNKNRINLDDSSSHPMHELSRMRINDRHEQQLSFSFRKLLYISIRECHNEKVTILSRFCCSLNDSEVFIEPLLQLHRLCPYAFDSITSHHGCTPPRSIPMTP